MGAQINTFMLLRLVLRKIVIGAWNKLLRRPPYKCKSCRSFFASDELDEHADYVAEVCSVALKENPLAAVFGSIEGSISTFDRTGRAYCPKCVKNNYERKIYGRTVQIYYL